MKEIKPKTFYELYNQHRTMLEPQLPNVSHEKVTSFMGQVIDTEQDWDTFFKKQLGENNINTQIKLPTSQNIEDKNKEIEFQQNQIENLNLQLEDANEANRILNCNNDVVQVQTDNLQTQIFKLKNELDISEKNKKHVTDMYEQKDVILNEATKIINQLRNKLSQNDDANKINAEHLAKKCLQLTDELARLKSDYTSLKIIYEETKKSAIQLPEEIIENNKLKEQLTAKDLLIISSKKRLDEAETSLAVSEFKCENIQKSYDVNQKIIAMLNKYIFDKNVLIDALLYGLHLVTKSGLFRRNVAVNTIKNYEDLLLRRDQKE
jgi:hypothetical protein